MKKLAFIFNQPVFGNLLSFVQGSGFNYKNYYAFFKNSILICIAMKVGIFESRGMSNILFQKPVTLIR
ncbi:hypothetical protein A8L51_21610 [Pantoea stewartii]|nr:hypothetical protein [Pantoea stewartii]